MALAAGGSSDKRAGQSDDTPTRPNSYGGRGIYTGPGYPSQTAAAVDRPRLGLASKPAVPGCG